MSFIFNVPAIVAVAPVAKIILVFVPITKEAPDATAKSTVAVGVTSPTVKVIAPVPTIVILPLLILMEL